MLQRIGTHLVPPAHTSYCYPTHEQNIVRVRGMYVIAARVSEHFLDKSVKLSQILCSTGNDCAAQY